MIWVFSRLSRAAAPVAIPQAEDPMVDEPEPESPLEPGQFMTMGEIGDAILARAPRSQQFSSRTFRP